MRIHYQVLLGDKLGTPELPRVIPTSLFHTLMTQLEDENETDLINKWYTEDLNAMPDGQFVIQPIHDILGM